MRHVPTSLGLISCACDAALQLTIHGVLVLWKRQLGPGRYHRTLKLLHRHGWLSPDPPDQIRTALAGAEIDARSLSIVEARPCTDETNLDLVRAAWDFDKINRAYDAYLENLAHPVVEPGAAAAAWLRREAAAWIAALALAPLLPEALLPPAPRRGQPGQPGQLEPLTVMLHHQLEEPRAELLSGDIGQRFLRQRRRLRAHRAGNQRNHQQPGAPCVHASP